MTDPAIHRAIAGAHEAERQQQRLQEGAQAAALALQSLPPSEITELIGNLQLHIANPDSGVTFSIHGPGNPRAYRVMLPAQFVDGMHQAMHGAEQNGAVHDEPEAT